MNIESPYGGGVLSLPGDSMSCFRGSFQLRPCVAGGPVGPDDCLQVLEPFEQLVLDHADPAGQHAVI